MQPERFDAQTRLQIGVPPAAGLGFDITRLECCRADQERRDVEGKQNQERGDHPPPGNRVSEDQKPNAKVIQQEPLLVRFEEREMFEDQIDEEEGQGQNGSRGRLHIEA